MTGEGHSLKDIADDLFAGLTGPSVDSDKADWGYVSSGGDSGSALDVALRESSVNRKDISLEDKIAPDLPKTISVTTLQTVETSKAKVGANIDPNRMRLDSVNQSAQIVKSSLSESVRSFQSAVYGTMKEMGSEYSGAFMDRAVSGSAVGLVASATLGGASPTAFLDLIYSEKANAGGAKGRQQLIAEIFDTVRSKFSEPAAGHGDAFNIDKKQAMPVMNDFNPRMDLIDQEEFETLMSVDPDNLPEHIFPAVRDLNTIQTFAQKELNNLDKAEKLVVADAFVDPDFYSRLAEVNFEMTGLEVDIASTVDPDIAETLFRNEPSQAFTSGHSLKNDFGMKV